MDEFYDECPDFIRWPDGSDVLVEVVRKHLPGVRLSQMRPLVYAMLGFPGLPGCNAINAGSESDFVLKQESVLLAMLMQAFSERAQHALNVTKNPTLILNVQRCVRLIRSSTHYIPGGAFDA